MFESTKGRFEATSIRLFCPKGHIKMSVLNDRHFSLVTIFRVICADLFHLNVMFIYFISCPNIPPIPVNEEDNKNMKCDLSWFVRYIPYIAKHDRWNMFWVRIRVSYIQENIFWNIPLKHMPYIIIGFFIVILHFHTA